MTVKEYLAKRKPTGSISFIICKMVKDVDRFYKSVYETTPLFYGSEKTGYEDYLILNDKATPIDWLSGSMWADRAKKGFDECMLIVSKDELLKAYGAEQANGIIEFIDKKIEERENKGQGWRL